MPRVGWGGAGLFPSLADDDWLWGGTLDAIVQTVTHGIRSDDEQARVPDAALRRRPTPHREQINAAAEYVLSLTGREPTPRRQPGARRVRGELRRLPW